MTSRPFRRLILPVSLIAAVALGWWAGGPRGTPETADPADPAAADPPDRRSGAGTDAKIQRRGAGEPGRLARIRQGASGTERTRSTIEMARNLPVREFASWLGEGRFSHRAGFELRLFREIVERRWQAEDPEGYVAWKIENGRAGEAWWAGNSNAAAASMLEEWAVSDPEKVEALLADSPNTGLEIQLISNLAERDPVLALKRLQAMIARGNEPSGYQLNALVEKLATQSPAEVEAMLADLPTQERLSAEGVLVGRRLSADFTAELADLAARPDGWRLFQRSIRHVEGGAMKLLEVLPDIPAAWQGNLASSIYAMVDGESGRAWLAADLEGMGFDEKRAGQLRQSVLSTLAYRAPEVALDHLNTSDLEGRAREDLLQRIFNSARGAPERSEHLLGLLSSDADRAIAEQTLNPEDSAPSRPDREITPDSFIELAVTGDERLMSSLYTVGSWDAEAQKSLVREFDGLSPEQQDQMAEALLASNGESRLRYLPREMAGQLVARFVAGPAAEDSNAREQIRTASSFVVSWGSDDPGAAGDWLSSLPEGEPKRWAHKNLAAKWMSFDPPAAERWLGSLPAETRAEVREFLDR